jgi:hypothetical protein
MTEPTTNETKHIAAAVLNASLTRSSVLANLFDTRRDIDDECGYPKEISTEQYRKLFDREGIATRCVITMPEESWAMEPEIHETEDQNETEFEKAWKELKNEYHLFHYLQRIDKLSGIGRYGILILGVNDGKDLSQPIEGINEKGEKVGNPAYALIYLRPLDESVVNIKTKETDMTNPRYGYPTMYEVTFESYTDQSGALNTKQVHWSRVIHVADNRLTSEILGVPRLQPVYNRVYDIRKILSGSGEMFWKGAFPGYTFEVNPDVSDAELDTTTLREEFEAYSNGLQRYLALAGVSAKSLAPQVADPTGHVNNQLKAIAITMSIPNRILYGSEEAKLASTQDAKTWNKRVAKRQEEYVSPLLIRPFIDRLITLGILPKPTEYSINWPDLNAPTDEDKAKIAEIKTKALAQYIKGSVDQLIPPGEFLSMIMKMDTEEVEAIIKAAELYVEEEPEEEPVEEPEEIIDGD